jgi:hypothetical protein
MVRTFPQINNISVAQYPIRKRVVYRQIINETISGEAISLIDPEYKRVYWDLNYEGLDADEWRRLSEFFAECEGRLHSFLFLDPVGNLLKNSEDLLEDAWSIDPLLEIGLSPEKGAGGVNVFRLTNRAQTSQEAAQVLPVPPHFTFCLSAYGRSAGSGELALRIASARGAKTTTFTLTERWQRLHVNASFATGPTGVRFGIQVPAGGSIEVMGIQVDPQLAPDGYRPTGLGGVYPESRFTSDEIHGTVIAPGLYACKIGVVSRMERS